MFERGKRLDKITLDQSTRQFFWDTRQVFDYSNTTLSFSFIMVCLNQHQPSTSTYSLIYLITRPDVMTVSLDDPPFELLDVEVKFVFVIRSNNHLLSRR